MLLIQKLKVDIDAVIKRNQELISNKYLDKLSVKQKKFLNWRKASPTVMNKHGLFGYSDLSNYLVYPDFFSEISINNLREYISMYDIKGKWGTIAFAHINEDLRYILRTIQKNRIKNIQKYIKLEDSIFEHGIVSNDTIYRTQAGPIRGDVIKNTTSWSLVPLEFFCGGGSRCHLYITTLPKNIKVLYLETNSHEKHLDNFNNFDAYEFEYVLPRDLLFEETKVKKIKILNHRYADKIPQPQYKTIYLHYITIIKKLEPVKFPVFEGVKLVCY